MDDFVLRVKQIGNYPFAATAAPTDALLIQQGGLGGSYAYINPAGITGALSARIDTLQIQLSGFNATVADLSTSWTDQFTQTIAHITDTTVWSFNGRRGDVGLTLWDIVEAGGASSQNAHLTGYPTTSNIQFATQTDSQIANTEFVQRAIAWRTKELLTTHPFVFSFMGRIGRVCLLGEDISWAGGALLDSPHFTGTPTAPDQLESDFSGAIANTRFVQRLIEDVRVDLSSLETVVYAEIDQRALATISYVQDNFAPINSPAFSGSPNAPTPPPGTNNSTLATTAFVMDAVASSVAGVATWNGRSGNVTLESGDLSTLGVAFLNSPAFTGNATAVTQPTGTSNTTLATTAFVLNEVAAIDAGVVTFNNRSGAVNLLLSDVTGVGGAPIASPNFSGTPTAVTASAGTSTPQLATTAFVTSAISAINTGVLSFEGRTGAVQLTANDISARGGALSASPTFTGTPAAPTATAGTSTTQIATTAFVTNAIAQMTGVATFNGRSGAVTLTAADITATGNILIQPGAANSPQLSLDKQTGAFDTVISGTSIGRRRWTINLGSATAESGGNTGSDFTIARYDDSGAPLGATVFSINRSSGAVTAAGAIFCSDLTASNRVYISGTGTLQVDGAAQVNGTLDLLAGLNVSGGAITANTIQTVSLGVTGGGNSLMASQSNVVAYGGYKPGGGPWSDSSDIRIKTVTSDYPAGLAEIVQLNPVEFVYKGNDELADSMAPRVAGGEPPYQDSPHYKVALDGTKFIGLVAQDIEQVMPEMVNKRSGYIDGVLVRDVRNLDTTPLIYALINAVKELASRLAALEAA